jgi:hypothetical protein
VVHVAEFSGAFVAATHDLAAKGHAHGHRGTDEDRCNTGVVQGRIKPTGALGQQPSTLVQGYRHGEGGGKFSRERAIGEMGDR